VIDKDEVGVIVLDKVETCDVNGTEEETMVEDKGGVLVELEVAGGLDVDETIVVEELVD